MVMMIVPQYSSRSNKTSKDQWDMKHNDDHHQFDKENEMERKKKVSTKALVDLSQVGSSRDFCQTIRALLNSPYQSL